MTFCSYPGLNSQGVHYPSLFTVSKLNFSLTWWLMLWREPGNAVNRFICVLFLYRCRTLLHRSQWRQWQCHYSPQICSLYTYQAGNQLISTFIRHVFDIPTAVESRFVFQFEELDYPRFVRCLSVLTMLTHSSLEKFFFVFVLLC